MNKHIIYDGMKWNITKRGYYQRRWGNGILRGKTLSLHRYIYAKYNGSIPKGYHIHHIDFNRKNNSIENLQLLSAFDHTSLHRKNKKASNKTKEKMSKSHMGIHTNVGSKHTEEHKRNIGIGSKKAWELWRLRKLSTS